MADSQCRERGASGTSPLAPPFFAAWAFSAEKQGLLGIHTGGCGGAEPKFTAKGSLQWRSNQCCDTPAASPNLRFKRSCLLLLPRHRVAEPGLLGDAGPDANRINALMNIFLGRKRSLLLTLTQDTLPASPGHRLLGTSAGR